MQGPLLRFGWPQLESNFGKWMARCCQHSLLEAAYFAGHLALLAALLCAAAVAPLLWHQPMLPSRGQVDAAAWLSMQKDVAASRPAGWEVQQDSNQLHQAGSSWDNYGAVTHLELDLDGQALLRRQANIAHAEDSSSERPVLLSLLAFAAEALRGQAALRAAAALSGGVWGAALALRRWSPPGYRRCRSSLLVANRLIR